MLGLQAGVAGVWTIVHFLWFLHIHIYAHRNLLQQEEQRQEQGWQAEGSDPRPGRVVPLLADTEGRSEAIGVVTSLSLLFDPEALWLSLWGSWLELLDTPS